MDKLLKKRKKSEDEEDDDEEEEEGEKTTKKKGSKRLQIIIGVLVVVVIALEYVDIGDKEKKDVEKTEIKTKTTKEEIKKEIPIIPEKKEEIKKEIPIIPEKKEEIKKEIPIIPEKKEEIKKEIPIIPEKKEEIKKEIPIIPEKKEDIKSDDEDEDMDEDDGYDDFDDKKEIEIPPKDAESPLDKEIEKVISAVEVDYSKRMDYPTPPQFDVFGRGLVYNCKGKHWACVNRVNYFRCKRNNDFFKKLNVKPECVAFDVYYTINDCKVIQTDNINKLIPVPGCD